MVGADGALYVAIGLILESADITTTANPSLEPSTESRRKGLSHRFSSRSKTIEGAILCFPAPPKMFASSVSRPLRPMDGQSPVRKLLNHPMNMFGTRALASSLLGNEGVKVVSSILTGSQDEQERLIALGSPQRWAGRD